MNGDWARRRGGEQSPVVALPLALLLISSCAGASPQLQPPRAALEHGADPREQGARPFDRQGWLDDYAALRAHLEHFYANLSWFGSPQGGVDVPALHARTLTALQAASDDAAAEAVIESFVNGFNDGHFSRLPRAEPRPAGAKSVPPPERSSPGPLACAALGYARTRGVAFSVRFEASLGFRLLATGEPESFRSGLAALPGGGALGVLRIPSFRRNDFPAECERAWSELTRTVPTGACDQSCASALEHRVMELALAGVQARLRELLQAGARAILVDLGGNGGGNDLGDWLPRAFTKAPVRSARLGLVRDPRSAQYFDEQLDGIREAQAAERSPKARDALAAAAQEYERLKALATGSAGCAMAWVWTERRSWSPMASQGPCTNLLFGKTYASGAVDYLPQGVLGSPKAEEEIYWPSIASSVIGSWTGPVYVVVDGRTASAAEIAAALFQDNAVARLVGTRTAGLGCGFMYKGSEYTLPHGKLRYRIPNCVRLRADGSDEVAGIRPDLEVPSYEGESDQERAVRFLDVVGRDLSTHR